MTSKKGMNSKLGRDFYLQPTLTVAAALIGKEFVFIRNRKKLSGRIVETEAYIGESDPACHARFGKTKRNAIMYGEGGHIYVYFVYGMYNMLNFVTEQEGFPAAVLIRALEPLAGIELMKQRRKVKDVFKLTSGPGKICRAFDIVAADTGIDLTGKECYVTDTGNRPSKIVTTPRIGINEGDNLLWRFYEAENKFVSR